MGTESANYSVLIEPSAQAWASAAATLPANRRRGWNTDLPGHPRGLFIGGDSTYRLFVQEVGGNTGEIMPYIDIAGGIVHPIKARRIIHTATHETDAPNIVILY